MTVRIISEEHDRWMGAMVGLAIGDQMGSLVEGKTYGSYDRIRELTEGSFWTDDTSQSLCIADSLISKGEFDINDILQRMVDWLFNGYLSYQDWGYGCGPTARLAITGFRDLGKPSPSDQTTNGALMRLAPVPLFFSKNMETAIEMSGRSSTTTHDDPICVDACRLYGSMIVKAFTGGTKSEILNYEENLWANDGLKEPIDKIARGSYKHKEPPPITGNLDALNSGHLGMRPPDDTSKNEESPYIKGTLDMVESLEASIWAYDRTSSFAEGAMRAVNLGDHTDTTAAIFGQLGGAHYGYSGIPESWKVKLVDRSLVEYIALKLYECYQ